MKLQIAGWLSRYQSAAACAVRKPAAANNGFDGNVKFTNLGTKRGKSKPPEPKSLNGGGVVLLKWGQRKRSKRTVADKTSGGVPMKPPPSKSGGGGGTTGCRGGGVAGGCGGTYLRPPRKLEDKMGGGGGSQSPSWKSDGGSRSISRSVLGKRSHSSTIDGGSKGSTMRKDQSENSLLQSEHPNGKVSSPPPDDLRRHHQQRKSNGEEWPRIHIGLSRKEKEEDFLAIKATKLSHRPKKRSKALDRNLQYCFPGTFLSDLSRSRYEVRERKSVRKPKRGGLKGLESMDSYSD